MRLDTKPARPSHVDDAVKRGDIEQLRISGRKGAEVTNALKAQKKGAADYYRERDAEREAEIRRESEREHIAPIDPEKMREED